MTGIDRLGEQSGNQAVLGDEAPMTPGEVASMLTDSALALHALAADAPVPAALKADMIFDMGVAALHLMAFAVIEAEPAPTDALFAGFRKEVDAFDQKYGRHVIGGEYEKGTVDTRQEEILEARIDLLREIIDLVPPTSSLRMARN